MYQQILETEIKILWVSYPTLVRKLNKLWASKIGTVYIRDRYVDTADKSIKKQWKSARLRSYGGEKFEITVKTKQMDPEYKVCKEENITVPTLAAGKLMLQIMWCQCRRYKEKIRVTYKIWQTMFDIDFYDDMPPVLEIEWEKNEINHYIRKLRLQDHQQVTRGAKKLFKHYGKKVSKMKMPVGEICM